MRSTAMALIWVRYSSRTYHVFNILEEKGAELKVTILGPRTVIATLFIDESGFQNKKLDIYVYSLEVP